jgi:hypothetical protein
MRNRQGGGRGRRWGWLVAALLTVAGGQAQADTSQLAVSAVVLSRSTCRFQSGPATINFGTIDPTSASPVSASTTMRFWCIGYRGPTTYAVVPDDGLYSPGAGLRRMRNTTSSSDYLAYSLSVSPSSGTLPWLAAQTITVTGTVAPADFQNARFGAYSDTVQVSLYP